MCSTPSGIMESVTYCPRVCALSAIRAQRLPASWNRSRISPPATCRPARCAQRLPASWNRSLLRRNNAMFNCTCSTPSGIMESVTKSCLVWVKPQMGCSTPSGIMESVTRNQVPAGRGGDAVLNAFRHHGIGHARRAGRGRASQPVLNAFRHHGIGHLKPRCAFTYSYSAQRLPASWNRSLSPLVSVASVE